MVLFGGALLPSGTLPYIRLSLLRPAQVELAVLKIEIAELILIGENWHMSTLNPVIFSLAEHLLIGEERYRRA